MAVRVRSLSRAEGEGFALEQKEPTLSGKCVWVRLAYHRTKDGIEKARKLRGL